MKKALFLFFTALFINNLSSQSSNFYRGADLSYVHEMEDCGVVYKEQGTEKELYQIFADQGANLIRFRLWHTPAWYDTLNAGHRYGDLTDVRQGISRAKAKGMNVLLDFHLSDTWASPDKQLVPKAWESVVNNLPLLQDSLYNYIYQTLLGLHNEGLLPEMVQIGNETNKGILLAPAVDAAGWSLDWPRNAALFKKAIQAVRAVENTTGKSIQVVLHVAGPANASWLMNGFWSNGVTDFDVIGLSYYWAWHKPTSISDAGSVISTLKQTYPGKQVMILETGYPWTSQWNDNANNIISEIHPGYAPASPANQRKWLIDLTQEMYDRGASGVLYWEPAWQSSPCWTAWGQGSHQEHATFFDFQNNLIQAGGVGFLAYNYAQQSPTFSPSEAPDFKVWSSASSRELQLQWAGYSGNNTLTIKLFDSKGVLVLDRILASYGGEILQIQLPDLPAGVYQCTLLEGPELKATQKLVLGH